MLRSYTHCLALAVIPGLLFYVAFSAPLLAEDCGPEVIQDSIDLNAVVNGWGLDQQNTRFVSTQTAGIDRDNIDRLQVKWVFGLPATEMPHVQPLVTQNTVFIGDEAGAVYALARDSGCTRWIFDAEASARTALRLVQHEQQHWLVFGDAKAFVYGLDPQTGKQRWRVLADEHHKAMISGSPVDYGGKVYVPVSSWEAFWAGNPFYACCTFRSSLLALDVASANVDWKSYVIKEPARITRKRWLLPNQWGPSGAPAWSAPTLDAKRKRVYIGTGENYSAPATDTSDAIIAFDMQSGEMIWSKQFLANDTWNVSCATQINSNCPEERGVDLDFGAPPILASVGNTDFILAGQKSGMVYALDPDKEGALLWARKFGRGGKLGGVHFSMGVDSKKSVLYVPISDRSVQALGKDAQGKAEPGLHAVDINTGETLWFAPSPVSCEESEDCFAGFSAAVTVTDDLVFAPALNGAIYAFAADSGKLLWQYDTARAFKSVNDVAAKGGSIDLGGVYLAGGQLFVTSGYDVFGQQAGNAFIVFELEAESGDGK